MESSFSLDFRRVYSLYAKSIGHKSIKFSKKSENKHDKHNICCTQRRFIDFKYSHTRQSHLYRNNWIWTFGRQVPFPVPSECTGERFASFEVTLWRCIMEDLLRESLKSRQTAISNRYSCKH